MRITKGVKSRRSSIRERGVAFVELAIILAIFTPILVGFVFVWLPDFSRRSNQLMNALSSLGGCLVDPINIYRFAAGQLVLRDDYEEIVQRAVASCGEMSEGQTVCGEVFKDDASLYRFGLNETPSLTCDLLDAKACTGMDHIPTGMVIGFLMSDGTSRCEYIPADDPGQDPQRGDDSGTGSGTSQICPPGSGYFEVACNELQSTPFIQVDVTCCATGTTYSGGACLGCPTGNHLCSVPGRGNYCLDNARFPGGVCVNESSNAGQYCKSTDQICNKFSQTWCCPTTDTCANFDAGSFSACTVADTMLTLGCPEGKEGTQMISEFPTCNLKWRYYLYVGQHCADPSTGDIVVPADLNQC
ncbi:MAG: hypothetical protein U0136_02000 [Bdellovibrionota bacterium]